MNKKKLYCQVTACLLILTAASYGGEIKNETFAKYYEKAKAMVMYQMSMEDVKSAAVSVSTALSGAPDKVVSAVAKINETSKYGVPIDEKSDEQIKQVHAVAGGVVTASGKDKEKGLYVEIRHEGGTSIYGNLEEISVVESERVQRGEIIGSYNTQNEKEFYYELSENL